MDTTPVSKSTPDEGTYEALTPYEFISRSIVRISARLEVLEAAQAKRIASGQRATANPSVPKT
jgi:hypothetical protein